jgi:hypothetical protein
MDPYQETQLKNEAGTLIDSPDDDLVKVETCSERLCLINECCYVSVDFVRGYGHINATVRYNRIHTLNIILYRSSIFQFRLKHSGYYIHHLL